MELQNALNEILQADIPTSLSQFKKDLNPDFIEDALNSTNTATIRKRKLPAQLAVWLIIAMGIFRDRSIAEVVSHLGIIFRKKNERKDPSKTRSKQPIAPSAIPQCRKKLGETPLQELFERTAKAWGTTALEKNTWQGLSLFGIDGSTFRVHDTESNRETFGLPSSKRGDAGYPQVRQVMLMTLRTHIIIGANLGNYRGKSQGEQSLAKILWKNLPDDSLTIMDKGFLNYPQLWRLHEQGQERHWLIAAKENLKGELRYANGVGDAVFEVEINAKERKKDPTLPRKMLVRVLHYKLEDGQSRYLMTSLLDAEKYPAKELIALYHERWELELGYDDIKTQMLCREETLRSKTPEGVRQELWGIMIAYNLIRLQMLRVAEAVNVPPIRVSFTHALRLVQIFCVVHAWSTAPSKIPNRLDELTEMIGLLILPERRTERRYKRHVKIKMSKYPRNVRNVG